MSTVYERIKARRKELKLSADDVAEALGVSRATIYRYESAEVEKVPITIISDLAKILQTSPEYLMGWNKVDQSLLIPDAPKVEHIETASRSDRRDDVEAEMLLFMYGLLSRDNKLKIVDIMKGMVNEQKGIVEG